MPCAPSASPIRSCAVSKRIAGTPKPHRQPLRRSRRRPFCAVHIRGGIGACVKTPAHRSESRATGERLEALRSGTRFSATNRDLASPRWLVCSARGEVIHFVGRASPTDASLRGQRRWAMPTLRWLTQRRAEYDSATADGRHQGLPELRERGEERAHGCGIEETRFCPIPLRRLHLFLALE
jgi:hypothetical protein